MSDSSSNFITASTVAKIFVERIKSTPTKRALSWRIPLPANHADFRPDQPTLTWNSVTWLELAKLVCKSAAVFQSLNVKRGSHVVLLSENRLEWITADLAIQLLGAVNVPLHSDSTAKQVCDLIRHCEPTAVIASTAEQREKLLAVENELPIIVFDGDWKQQTNQCESLTLDQLRELAKQIQPNDLISILYTSGTTGEPKGVMLTHQNIASNVISKLATLPLGPEDHRLGILPFSHVFARVCDLYTWIASGSELYLSLGWEHVFQELASVRPTYINAVPYFYEKCWRELESRGNLNDPNALNILLGGRTKVCNCGGAPLADHVANYFSQRQVGLVTGYGLTETSPVVSSCRIGQFKLGSVGPAIPDVEICIADDGEVLVRGNNVMAGYFKDKIATDSVLIDDWFHTGDLGRLDEDGFLYIIGRKKELIVTTGGKNIAPHPIENQLNSHPSIDQSFVFGDQRDYLVALIVPESKWRDELDDDTAKELMAENVVESLKDFSKYELARKIALVAPFTVENGMLTAKRSLRRDNIIVAYLPTIDALYDG